MPDEDAPVGAVVIDQPEKKEPQPAEVVLTYAKCPHCAAGYVRPGEVKCPFCLGEM